MNTPIIVGATYKHNGGGNYSRNGWIGKVTGINHDWDRPILVNFTLHNCEATYSKEWFKNNMLLITRPVPQYDYILWNPESNLPPKRTYPTYEEAMRVSKVMRNKNPGKQFHVMKRIRETEKSNFICYDEFAVINEVDFSKLELKLLDTKTGRWSHCQSNFERITKMKEVKLLCVDDKVIEITEHQADLLSTDKYKDTNHSYIIKTALKNNDDYYEANKIHVTKKD